MSTQLISFPPRLGPQGNFVVRDDDDSDYYAEELGILLLVRPGERDLSPDFGTSDPAFNMVDVNEFVAKVAMFGPPVNILDVTTFPLAGNSQDVRVVFTPADREEEETRTSTTDVDSEGTA